MKQWIHVDTQTKTPVIRTGLTPFEYFEEGFDPNVDTPFGPDKETMFLEVVEEDTPSINPVTEQLQIYYTDGWEGKYVDPNWVKGYDVLEQDLEISKDIKIDMLQSDRDTAISEGYTVGPFKFPYTEHFFRLLADRLRWLEDAIAALAVPSDTELTFSDLADKEVSVGYDTLKANFVNFGKEYLTIYEKEVDARKRIAEATTITDVDAVSWSF